MKNIFYFFLGIILIATIALIYTYNTDEETETIENKTESKSNNDDVKNKKPKPGIVLSMVNYVKYFQEKPKKEEVEKIFIKLLKDNIKNKIDYRLENLKVEDCKKSKYKDVFECLISVRVLTKDNVRDRKDNLYLRKENNEWKIIGMDK